MLNMKLKRKCWKQLSSDTHTHKKPATKEGRSGKIRAALECWDSWVAAPSHSNDRWKVCLNWKTFSETGSFNSLPLTLEHIIQPFS